MLQQTLISFFLAGCALGSAPSRALCAAAFLPFAPFIIAEGKQQHRINLQGIGDGDQQLQSDIIVVGPAFHLGDGGLGCGYFRRQLALCQTCYATKKGYFSSYLADDNLCVCFYALHPLNNS